MAWLRPSARAPPPAFLFPIQRCQRPRPAPPAPLFSADGRRRRLSMGPPRPCQPDFSVFFENLEINSKTLENRSTPKRLRHQQTQEIQGLLQFVPAAIRPGRRLSRGPPRPRQPGFFSFFSKASGRTGKHPKTDRPSATSPPANPSDPRDLFSPSRRRPVRGGGCLGPSPGGVNSAHDASMILVGTRWGELAADRTNLAARKAQSGRTPCRKPRTGI